MRCVEERHRPDPWHRSRRGCTGERWGLPGKLALRADRLADAVDGETIPDFLTTRSTAVIASGALGAHACQALNSATARSIGTDQETEKMASSLSGTSLKRNVVATPKLPPPPPRQAQKRSGCSLASAVISWPLASTSATDWMLSQVRPKGRASNPYPPPSAWPDADGRAGACGEGEPAGPDDFVDRAEGCAGSHGHAAGHPHRWRPIHQPRIDDDARALREALVGMAAASDREGEVGCRAPSRPWRRPRAASCTWRGAPAGASSACCGQARSRARSACRPGGAATPRSRRDRAALGSGRVGQLRYCGPRPAEEGRREGGRPCAAIASQSRRVRALVPALSFGAGSGAACREILPRAGLAPFPRLLRTLPPER